MNGYGTFRQLAAIFLRLFRVRVNGFRYRSFLYGFSEFVLRDPFGLQMFGYGSDSMLLCFGSQKRYFPILKLDADYRPVACHPQEGKVDSSFADFRMSILRLSHRQESETKWFSIQHGSSLVVCLRRLPFAIARKTPPRRNAA
jgi:hypothetical protein